MTRRRDRDRRTPRRRADEPRGAAASAGRPGSHGQLTRIAIFAGLALVFLAPIAIHLPAVGAPFFADDYLFVDQARGRSLPALLGAPDPIGNFFRPVGRQLWFWTVTRVFGESPAAFHALGLLLFLGTLALFHRLAGALAGPRAALIGTVILAVHYASDVPVRWAAGSQDLLAVLGAMAALYLYIRRRAAWAAVALLAGLLSKETVAFTPLIAIALGRGAGETWRGAAIRAWPLFAAVAVWAALWIARSPQPLAASSGVSIGAMGALAALAHLVQVLVGWEARTGQPLRVTLASTALVAPLLATFGAGLALPRLRRERANRDASTASPLPVPAIGIAWAVLATVPVAAVASIWSAYYYLFAIAGVALALGAWASRWPTAAALALLALLGVGSAIGRSLDDFAISPDPWAGRSHLNRFYIDRAVRESSRYLEQLMRTRRQFPAGSTVFFAGVKGSVAFQTADGPLLRWAYRDPTLHSYYLNQFSRALIGDRPVFLYYVMGDSLKEAAQGLDTFGRIAFGFTINDRLAEARDVLQILRERGHGVAGLGYYEGWLAWSLRDTVAARALFDSEGIRLAPGPTPQVDRARAAIAAGDTAHALDEMHAAVREHSRDPIAHALLADLLLLTDPNGLEAVLETIATRALTPEDPLAWRRLAMLQIYRERYAPALATLQKYLAMAGPSGRADAEAQHWLVELERRSPSGVMAHEALRQ